MMQFKKIAAVAMLLGIGALAAAPRKIAQVASQQGQKSVVQRTDKTQPHQPAPQNGNTPMARPDAPQYYTWGRSYEEEAQNTASDSEQGISRKLALLDYAAKNYALARNNATQALLVEVEEALKRIEVKRQELERSREESKHLAELEANMRSQTPDPEKALELSKFYEQNNNIPGLIRALEVAAPAHPELALRLARMHEQNKYGVAANLQLAEQYYRLGAKYGDPTCLYTVAYLEDQAASTAENDNQRGRHHQIAQDMREQAAKKGNASAAFDLALQSLKSSKFDEALRYIEMALNSAREGEVVKINLYTVAQAFKILLEHTAQR